MSQIQLPKPQQFYDELKMVMEIKVKAAIEEEILTEMVNDFKEKIRPMIRESLVDVSFEHLDHMRSADMFGFNEDLRLFIATKDLDVPEQRIVERYKERMVLKGNE